MENTLKFLKSLSENNNREWFNEHKSDFESVKKQLESLSRLLISEISKFDSGISTLQPKDTMFRIYRDVRFSHNKTPYKTNMGLFFVAGGKKSNLAGYYLHIEPGNSFIGGGNHNPQPIFLKMIRDEIYSNSEEFKNIVNQTSFINSFGSLSGDKLVRPPKGFDPGFKEIEYLKYKDYTVFQKLSDEDLLSKDFLKKAVNIFSEMKGFIFYLNRAISTD